MADIVWADVTGFAPELTTVSAGAQTLILAYVNDEALDSSVFGGESANMYKMARIYLAAHRGTLTLRGGTAGPVTSESAGGLSRSYGSGMTSSTGLESTVYGQEFLALCNASLARSPVILGDDGS